MAAKSHKILYFQVFPAIKQQEEMSELTYFGNAQDAQK
jgi:hypothetical protein